MASSKRYLPAEWHPQDAVMMAWPNAQTDWSDNLKAAQQCVRDIALAITRQEKLLMVCHDEKEVRQALNDCPEKQLITVEVPYNDTWTRDFGPLTMINHGQPEFMDFQFNGWGKKYEAGEDNAVTRKLIDREIFRDEVAYIDCNDFVLEGGSVETDGVGTLLTTHRCLTAPNRNQPLTARDIEQKMIKAFNLDRVVWLTEGHLEGDDTDAHVDTLARFCNPETITYVGCEDENDTHYESLKAMENELRALNTPAGQPYQLLKLPMAPAIKAPGGHRLPATYANFLIINEAVLLPFYGHPDTDEAARHVLMQAFPDREIIGIDCLALILQHGSLHCVTMQLPKGTI